VTELAPSHKAAILARVATKIGPVPPDGGGGGDDGGGGGASTGGALAAKGAAGAKTAIALAATFALGVAAGVVGDRTLSPAPPAPITPATIAAPPAPEPTPPAPEATRGVPVSALPSVAPARPVASIAASVASEPAPSARGLAAERALLDVGRSALARGEAAEALAAADRHAKTYPEGALVEEREAIAIKALVGLGRRDEARARAAELERKYPNSLVLRAVKNAVDDPR
jgi:hypothetical protein